MSHAAPPPSPPPPRGRRAAAAFVALRGRAREDQRQGSELAVAHRSAALGTVCTRSRRPVRSTTAAPSHLLVSRSRNAAAEHRHQNRRRRFRRRPPPLLGQRQPLMFLDRTPACRSPSRAARAAVDAPRARGAGGAFLADGLLGQCLEIDEVLQVRGQRSDVLRAHLLRRAAAVYARGRRGRRRARRRVGAPPVHYAVVDDFLAGGSPLWFARCNARARRAAARRDQSRAPGLPAKRPDEVASCARRAAGGAARRAAIARRIRVWADAGRDARARHRAAAARLRRRITQGRIRRHVDETGASAESIQSRPASCTPTRDGSRATAASCGSTCPPARWISSRSTTGCSSSSRHDVRTRFSSRRSRLLSVWYCTTILS